MVHSIAYHGNTSKFLIESSKGHHSPNSYYTCSLPRGRRNGDLTYLMAGNTSRYVPCKFKFNHESPIIVTLGSKD